MDPADAVRPARGAGLGLGAAIAVVLAVAAVVIAIAVWRGATAPVEIVPDAPSPAGAAATDAGVGGGPGGAGAGTDGAVDETARGEGTPAGGAGAQLFVHVFGAVEEPGLYALPAGARVVDAVSAAGGVTDEAAPEGVNLARGLSDGEQVGVPTVAQLEAGEAAAPVLGAADGPTPEAARPVDLNTADQAELETLPGIGPALAQRVIAWREENGGFASVDDLLAVSGIGEKVLAGLQDRVTV
ncbi:helix-hairpin-helix domain-containing protein [Microbacterium halophytorum]|uniref:helix-hairpin-helix domain-containing protein n=1 Tax=Microbacterium halophytorum TaxID=2067568 RepID=UPI000CFB9C94|nr:ComEA family DNA-binding protein [Microbacterium halophytorum]